MRPSRVRLRAKPTTASTGTSQPTMHERLEPVPRVARDEVGELGRVALDLGERARLPDRVPDRKRPDEESGGERPGDGACGPTAVASSQEHVGTDERDRTEREVDLPGERDRGQRCGSDDVTAPFPRPERERQQHRDPREQVSSAALDSAVGREREGGSPDQGGAPTKPERSEPEEREPAGADVAEQDERVPRTHRPEQGVERPERKPERPAGEVHAWLRLRPEAVRVAQGALAAAQLVPGKPELPRRLEMVAGRGGARQSATALGHEVAPNLLQRRPRRDEARAEVDG